MHLEPRQKRLDRFVRHLGSRGSIGKTPEVKGQRIKEDNGFDKFWWQLAEFSGDLAYTIASVVTIDPG